MACHGRDYLGFVAGRLAEETPPKMGFLGFPSKQRALGDLGMARSRLCANRASIRAGVYQHPWGLQEQPGRVIHEKLRIPAPVTGE